MSNDDELPTPPPDASPEADATDDIEAIEISMSNVRMAQIRVADALTSLFSMPRLKDEGPLLHLEVLIALSNIYIGCASDWMARSPREEFAFARGQALGLLGNISAALNAVTNSEEDKQKVH